MEMLKYRENKWNKTPSHVPQPTCIWQLGNLSTKHTAAHIMTGQICQTKVKGDDFIL